MTGTRLFVAVVPPASVLDDLAEFLEPRQEAGADLRWTVRDQWHLTLAFMPSVLDRHLDDLGARLEQVAGRRTPFEVRLAGGGCFPDPVRAKVLYARLAGPDGELAQLAAATRAAAAKAGSSPDGGPFTPHVTLARSRSPVEATRWLRELDTYHGPPWPVQEIVLVASHLGEGPRRRPRHEVLASWALGTGLDPGVHLSETGS